MSKIDTRYNEVFDAITEHYKGNTDVVTDCVLYLSQTVDDARFLDKLSQWLMDNDKCLYCGHDMTDAVIKDMGEKRMVSYCPKCTFDD